MNLVTAQLTEDEIRFLLHHRMSNLCEHIHAASFIADLPEDIYTGRDLTTYAENEEECLLIETYRQQIIDLGKRLGYWLDEEGVAVKLADVPYITKEVPAPLKFPIEHACGDPYAECEFYGAGIGMQCRNCRMYKHPGDSGHAEIKGYYDALAKEESK